MKTEYKVDDKVICVERGRYWVSTMDLLLGKTFIVQEIDDAEKTIYALLDNGEFDSGFWLGYESIELWSGKYLDGVPISDAYLPRRTAKPEEMTLKQIEEALGKKIKII